ncbi:integrase catalytic domain-containing protein [Trichonephila clavipes]|nr:integrase catalytic domain-containing protein [Trichonephila clavipes]
MDEANNFPLAAPVVMSDCCMDDILSGSESIEEEYAFLKSEETKALGIIWNPKLDCFLFRLEQQRLWLLELGWSDELSFKEQKEWRQFIDSLEALNNISIDRCNVIHKAESIGLSIKSVKYHPKRALGRSRLTYEAFETVIIQVEGIFNSRTLTPISNDFDNFEGLTPIIEPIVININDNRLSRWQKTTKVIQVVWKKCSTDYLNTLQQRGK